MVMGLIPLTTARAFPTLDFREVPTPNGAVRQVSDPTIPRSLLSGHAPGIGFHVQVDFQGNGRPDTLLCHYGELNEPIACRTLRPNADGSLTDTTRQVFGNGALPRVEFVNPIIVDDFNNDARSDLYFANWGWDFPPFAGERGGLFTSADGTYVDRSSTLPQAVANVYGACSGDVDGDGSPDIYVLNFKSTGLEGAYLLMGKGDGTFTQSTRGIPAELLGINKGYSISTCAIADVDRDGHADLILLTFGDVHSENLVLFNDGTGDFTKRPRHVLPAGSFKPGDWEFDGIAVLDINRDGFPDLVLAASPKPIWTGAAFQILINRGDGTFADETATRLLGPNTYLGFTIVPAACIPLLVADLDGDGWEDLYCNPFGALDNQVPPIWMNDGSGRFTPAALDAPGPFGAVTVGALTDFDRDGQLDVVVFLGASPSGDIWYRTYRNHMARTVPSEPFISKAKAGDAQASISFTPPLASGASPITGYAATCTQGTRAGTFVSSGPASPLTVTGLTNGKPYLCTVTATNAKGTSLPSAASRVSPVAMSPNLVDVVEYYNAALDHYFITFVPDEIGKLDAGTTKGWQRTGLGLRAYGPDSAGTSPVCRIYIPPGQGDGHFFGRDGNECDGTMAKHPSFTMESRSFFALVMPILGECPVGMAPVYRVFSNRTDANHRYTTDRVVRSAMVAKGWVAEGDGSDAVVMCAP